MLPNALLSLELTKNPPAGDELEVSVFGPGVGESIVIHIGEGEWAVVDSCRTGRGSGPVALEYLRALGVDTAKSVRLVVASHFHDDHIQGLSEVLERCPAASFVCSSALRSKEFFELVEANKVSGLDEAGTSEFDRILQLLVARAALHQRFIAPTFAGEGTIIFERKGTGTDAEIRALSPSSPTVAAAVTRIAAVFPRTGETKRSLSDIGANSLSLALWVRVGNTSVILGGDLEDNGHDGEGWRAVVTSSVRPQGSASLFKIPHHGSPTAQHDAVWAEMLQREPVAVVAPFARGRRKLPATADIRWLCDKTPEVYLTSSGLSRPPRSRGAVVERVASRVAVSRQALPLEMGGVTVRINSFSGETRTELFGAAQRQCGERR